MGKIRTNTGVLLLLLAAVHIFYYPTWNAGLVTDFNGLQWRLEGKPWHGFLHSFGFPSMEQFLYLIMYVFYSLFGAKPLPWYLLFSSLHILNAWLLYLLAKRVFTRFSISWPTVAAAAAALCFALSPYHTEPVVWKVCLSYLLSSMLILLCLHLALAWIEHGRRRRLIAAHIVFSAALFTFEMALVIPLLCLLLAWMWRVETGALPRGRFARLAAPQWMMMAFYFALNKIVLGSWVGYYGEEVHLRFPLTDMAANFWRYAAKLGLFGRYLDLPVKQAVFGKLDQPAWVWALSAALAAALLAGLYFYRRLPGSLRAGMFFIAGFAVALGPVLNLYFNNLQRIDGDRYTYVASMFFFAFLAALLFGLGRKFAVLFFAGFAVFSVYYLRETNTRWVESTRIYHSLLENYDRQNHPNVFILNLPDNYRGAPMFRDFAVTNRALASPLHFMAGKTPAGDIREVIQYNMAGPEDGVSVLPDSAGVLRVEFNQYGNWWWRGSIGGGAYATPEYRFQPGDRFYRMHLDAIPPDAVLLYQVGGKWHEVERDFYHR